MVNDGPTSSPGLPKVLLYTRARCHLCDEAKQQLRSLQKKTPFELREIDIDQDAELQRRYDEEVPVIFIHGRKAFKYRIEPRQFLKRLQAPSEPRSRRAGERPPGPADIPL